MVRLGRGVAIGWVVASEESEAQGKVTATV